jgi:hypothetical protein
MDIPWLGIAIGAVGMAAIELSRAISRRREATAFQPPAAMAAPAELIRYLLWAVCFPLSFLPAIWFAADSSRTPTQTTGAMYGLVALFWLFIGLIPTLVAAYRGRSELAAFQRKVEQYSRSRFKSLFLVWLLGIGVMVTVSIMKLLAW